MLPTDFINRMQTMLSSDFEDFMDSFEQDRYQSLRINKLKFSVSNDTEVQNIQTRLPFTLTPVPWEASGFYYPNDQRPGKHPYHEAGLYYIQEPSAMAPAAYLDAKPGDFVLDLCAAPGGKSTQIASALQNEGLLISNEIVPARAKILSENIERMGIRNCIVTNESPARLASHFPEYFDKIMVDAPCSGEGMFRKNEDAVTEWSLDNVTLCGQRQNEILDHAATMLRPGGRMVFSTCTFAATENEGSIARFLQLHPDFHLIPAKLYDGMSPGNPDWLSASDITDPSFDTSVLDKTIRLWPHKLKGEGHFVAILEKDGPTERGYLPEAKHGFCKTLKEKDYQEWLGFKAQQNILLPDGCFVRFKDQLYLLPDYAPSIDKLKVLRPGLHLGTILKNRFEPSHALALALHPEEIKYHVDLSIDDPRIYAYLNGETFPYEGEKGWYLITVDGYSTGFGKSAGGTMKNHYPKGLRKTGWV